MRRSRDIYACQNIGTRSSLHVFPRKHLPRGISSPRRPDGTAVSKRRFFCSWHRRRLIGPIPRKNLFQRRRPARLLGRGRRGKKTRDLPSALAIGPISSNRAHLQRTAKERRRQVFFGQSTLQIGEWHCRRVMRRDRMTLRAKLSSAVATGVCYDSTRYLFGFVCMRVVFVECRPCCGGTLLSTCLCKL